MTMKKYFSFFIFHFLFIISLSAQGTVDDYNRAYSLQRTFTWSKVLNHVDDARWLSDGRFQYHLTDGARGVWHFGQINADGSITLADTTTTRPIEEPRGRRDQASPVRFIANPSKRRQQRHWMETDDERGGDPVLSPDSSLVAFIRNDNVYVAKPDGSEARALSTEGTLSHYFSSYIHWSPDSRYVAVNRIRPVEKRYVYYVESSPADQLQPILHKQEYALIANQYSLNGPSWRKDSRAIRFEYNQRGHKLYRVYEMPTPAASKLIPSAASKPTASASKPIPSSSALGGFAAESIPLRVLIEEREETSSKSARRNMSATPIISAATSTATASSSGSPSGTAIHISTSSTPDSPPALPIREGAESIENSYPLLAKVTTPSLIGRTGGESSPRAPGVSAKSSTLTRRRASSSSPPTAATRTRTPTTSITIASASMARTSWTSLPSPPTTAPASTPTTLPSSTPTPPSIRHPLPW